MPPNNSPPSAAAAVDHHHHDGGKKLEFKTTLQSFKSKISPRHCAWLTTTVLLQLLILFILNRASPPPISAHQRRRDPDETCIHGRIYVYDLPPMLNKDLLDNCRELDPWKSSCDAVSNAGFGPQATGLDGVVPKTLSPAWYWTDMYSAEVIYHDRALNFNCRTGDPNQATAFYIPFYAGLAVGKFLWYNYTSADRDFHSVAMLDWVSSQSTWRKSNGSDHFIMVGRLTWDFRRLTDDDGDWGTRLYNMPLMRNVLRLSVERSPWDELEISVPYPTAFHPRSESDIRQWQNLIRSRKRSSPFTFVGATREKIQNDFRGVLMRYCKNERASCRVVDCSVSKCYDGAPEIMEAFLDSDFCLQPKGDGSTRRSFFDCMLAGSIPVYFWRGSFEGQYQWHLPRDASTYSVFIDNNIVRNDTKIIKNVLKRYSKEEVRKMREKIIDFLPKLLYTKSNTTYLGSVDDAFDIAMEGVLKRFKYLKKIN
ncbi:hypothetical protein ACS0TY_030097 [Phlomoides rotata]